MTSLNPIVAIETERARHNKLILVQVAVLHSPSIQRTRDTSVLILKVTECHRHLLPNSSTSLLAQGRCLTITRATILGFSDLMYLPKPPSPHRQP